MKYLFSTILFMTLRLLVSQGISDQLLELYRIDRIPLYTENSSMGQFSSYDRTGGNDDGFNGTYSYIRKEGNDLVIAEMKGPGVIHRIWTPTPTDDTIQFYFDGEDHPRISMPFIDLFSGNQFPFTAPLCGNEVGGYFCYLPIPYQRSCKVVLRGKMLFYQIQYSSCPESTDINTFSLLWSDAEKEALEKVSGIWGSYGTNFLSELYTQIETREIPVRIKPGENHRVFDLSGGGRIVGLEITGISSLDEDDNCLIMKARWDGEKEWAINTPVKDFFGYHFGVKSMRSLLAGTSGDISYCWYPMPFSQRAIIEFEYLESVTALKDQKIGLKIYYNRDPRRPDEGKFYTHWKREKSPQEGRPYDILPELRTKGHYVGTLLNCQGLIPGTTGFFEGDDQTTIDGVLSVHGTGSEDYFNGGWYAIPDRWDMAHSLPSHGCLGYNIPMSRTGGYRHYFADKLSFGKSFRLTIEHGPEGNRHPVDYASIAYFYAENTMDQQAPSSELVSYPRPGILKFPGNHMNILAFRNGRIVNGESFDRKRVLIMELENKDDMQVKFRLEAPVDGHYKLYCSYFMFPTSSEVKFSQRQNDLGDWKEMTRQEKRYVEKDYIGMLHITDGSATLSVHVRGEPGRRFFLHYFQLELNKPE